MRSLIKLVTGALKSRIFLDESFILYEYHKHSDIKSTIELKEAKESNLDDVLDFDTNRNYLSMKKMLKNGEKGKLGYSKGKCIHRSWFKDSKGKALIFKFLPIQLTEDDVYIHDCATSIEVRGQSIYPYVISKIARDAGSGKRILIATNVNNIASVRGIEKAGFKGIELWRIKVILGFKKRFRTKINKSDI